MSHRYRLLTSVDDLDPVAERLGIRHQSPQALLVRNGTIAWHASRHRLSQAEMARAIERVIHPEPYA